ncbi:uncharacterized protein LOC123552851 [Mercenaria mercenaria]|uniref:uncharacterized protein LOC123552851 n=1 Tax=Mercenaria mercenaria TaxID=6596 RepID=UPI00234F5FA9|nr:uncharacterized protein LOC123552851 [Mercenaria mercenaria]
MVPVHPDDSELLGFQVQGLFYFDKTLPMGLSYSCALFERISTAIQWIAENKLNLRNCAHILDDFFFVETDYNQCLTGLHIFLDWAKYCGIPINPSKTVLPCTTITFVGIELDSVAMEMRLPEDKIIKIRTLLNHYQRRKKLTLQELQSLIGLLNFACAVIRPGRAFLRRLIDLTVGLKKSFHKRRLTLEARADLTAWSSFMNKFNGKSLFLEDRWYTSDFLELYTDASNLGFGGFLANQWFSVPWPEAFIHYHLTIKEFFPIVLLVELFSSSLANKCIMFYCDNEAVVAVINQQTSKNVCIMKLVRRLVVVTMAHNILFRAQHIPGIHNDKADALSRLQVKAFLRTCPSSIDNRVAIPEHMLTI